MYTYLYRHAYCLLCLYSTGRAFCSVYSPWQTESVTTRKDKRDGPLRSARLKLSLLAAGLSVSFQPGAMCSGSSAKTEDHAQLGVGQNDIEASQRESQCFGKEAKTDRPFARGSSCSWTLKPTRTGRDPLSAHWIGFVSWSKPRSSEGFWKGWPDLVVRTYVFIPTCMCMNECIGRWRSWNQKVT